MRMWTAYNSLNGVGVQWWNEGGGSGLCGYRMKVMERGVDM